MGGIFPDYKIRYCIEWEDMKFGWIVAQSFIQTPPDFELRPIKVKERLLIPNLLPCKVEIQGNIIDKVINFNICSLVYINPKSLKEELKEFDWDQILGISDGYWNKEAGVGIIHPEANMGLTKGIKLTKSELLRCLHFRSQGGIVVKVANEHSCEIYFSGQNIRDIIGRIHTYSVMVS